VTARNGPMLEVTRWSMVLDLSPWLRRLNWPWPTWRVRSRPFDRVIDCPDFEPDSVPALRPERRRFNLYLRGPEGVER
jgi:hypothetical protein